MSNNIKILSLVLFSFLLNKIFAQTNIYEIESIIKTELNTKYGEVYSVGVIENVNEEIDNYRDSKFPIMDPYNTLIDCYIFPAYVTEGGLLGVYKNGTIIWDSGPIIEPGVDEDIFGTIDLNSDGSVEIISSFYYGMNSSSQSIWIYSWNGQEGNLLNEVIINGSLNKSVIFSFDWFTDIFDIEGDDILEIKGQDEETRETKIYSWNGNKYGDFGVPLPQYVPMNLLTANVNCKVERSQYGLLYGYTLKNDSTSKQPIWRFAVEKPFEDVYAGSDSPNMKWNNYSSDNYDLNLWEVNTDLQKFPFDYLYPGDEKSDFKLETETPLIYIGEYYIQGKNGEEPDSDLYILENSFSGKTLCGQYPPSPFIPINFLDTLINYNQRSLEFSWIMDTLTTNKYDSLLILAKTQFQQNSIAAVQNTLQTILQEVDQDSSDNISNEAYALLRFNTEYLLENLPEPVNSISIFSLFATHSLWLEQNSEVLSGDIGVNEAGSPPFLDSDVELSIGIGSATPSGYTVKANRIKVKQNAAVNGDIYFNQLDNNGTITGSQNTPLELPLVTSLPEFKSSTPGTQNINVPQNGEQTLQPGSYNDIDIKKNGRLIFTGGEYYINSFTGGDNNQIIFQSPAEVRIAGKFDSGQGSYIGAEDTTTMSAKDIVFYVAGINGSNGNLSATPKAAKIGISNIVKANFYVPNGTLWIRQNSEVEGAFVGKDVDVGISVKVRLNSAF